MITCVMEGVDFNMRRLYEKGMKGVALILAGLLAFTSVFTGDMLRAKADVAPTAISVCAYDSSKCTVEYNSSSDPDHEVWTTVPSGGSANGYGIKVTAAQNNRITGVTTDPATLNTVDDQNRPLSLNIGGELANGNPIFFNANDFTNISISAINFQDTSTPIEIKLKANPYTDTHGKIQYSVDGNTGWTDVPAAGIGDPGVDAGFVRAVPENGYGVSYKLDNTPYTDTDPHSLGSGSGVHYVQDIEFKSNVKNLTVGAYDTAGGTIKYSANGTDWSDIAAAGGTVQANYVKAVPNSNYILDSYKLNSGTIYSDNSQKLTADNNTVSDISFVQSTGNGKYNISIDDQTNGACTATITFLDSAGAEIATASTGSTADIPDGTTKIRIALTDKAFLKSIQIFRNTAPNEPGSGGSVEIARPDIEEGLWQSGTVEFTASKAYSYAFRIEFSNTKNVGWSYKDEDKDTDKYVENCKLYLLDSNGQRRPLIDESDGNKTTTDYGSYNLTIGQTYKFELVPDYGYQITGLSINGYMVTPTDDTGVFSFTMSNTNFHFKGVVSRAEDIVSTDGSTAVNNAKIEGGNNAASSGNVKMTVSDAALDTAAVAAAGAGATGVATVNIDLANVISKGDGSYWSSAINTTSSDVTVGLAVSSSGLSEGETYSVVRDHDGVKTKLNATYNSTTGMLTFPSNQFSNYTIVKVSGTPATGSDEQVQSNAEDSSSSSSGTSSSGSSDNSTPPSAGGNTNVLGVVNGTNKISSWNDLDNVLKAGGNQSVTGSAAGTTDKKGVTSTPSLVNIVSLSLTGNKQNIPASTFDSLENSNTVDGLHIFCNNGIALTFGKNKAKTKTKQGALDISAKVTKTAGSTKIAFNKSQLLTVPTALHTTVPKGTKSVKLFYTGADGKQYLVRTLEPTADGNVMFGVVILGTYELKY